MAGLRYRKNRLEARKEHQKLILLVINEGFSFIASCIIVVFCHLDGAHCLYILKFNIVLKLNIGGSFHHVFSFLGDS